MARFIVIVTLLALAGPIGCAMPATKTRCGTVPMPGQVEAKAAAKASATAGLGGRVRVHFRRDMLGVNGPVGLDVPPRSLETFSVVGNLVARDAAWLRLRDAAGREVEIPVTSVLAVIREAAPATRPGR